MVALCDDAPGWVFADCSGRSVIDGANRWAEKHSTMRYLVALLIPPLAVFSCGKLISFVCNAILYSLAWVFLLMGVGSLVLPIVAIAAILLVPLAAVF